MELAEDIADESREVETSAIISQSDSSTIHPSPSSTIWKYMLKQGPHSAKCIICGVLLSRKNGSTTSLRKHLCQVHQLKQFETTKNYNRSKSSQFPLEQRKKLHSLIIECIVEDGRSFDDARRPGLLKVFNCMAPGYVPPHRNTVQRRLKRLNAEHKILLMDELTHVRSIGVTCDFWADKRLYSYMCLTGHFVTSKFQFVSQILSFSWFHHRHSSINIGTAIETKLKELNIYEKVTSITTDGAANMVKMFDFLRPETKRVHCIAHRLHLVVCNSLGLWIRKPQDLSSSNVDSNQRNNTDIEHSDDEDFTDDLVSNVQSLSIDEMQETSNILEEVVSDDLDDDEKSYDESAVDEESSDIYTNLLDDNWSLDIQTDSDSSICEPEQEAIGALMKKCRSFIKLVKKSSILMNYIVHLKQYFNVIRSLQIHCKSRWNSTYRLIETMLMYKKVINRLNSEKNDIGLNYKQTRKLSSIELDLSDWKMMESLEFVLKPFIQATKLLSGSQYSTIGLAFFAIAQIRDFLEDSKSHGTSGSKQIHLLKILILNKMEFYFDEHDDQWSMMKKHAHFDPIGYGCLTCRERKSIEVELIEKYSQIIENETNLEEQQIDADASPQQHQNSSNESVRLSSMKYFLNSIGKQQISTSATTQTSHKSSFNEELVVYRSLAQREYALIVDGSKDSNIMEFWYTNRFDLKILSQLAAHFLVTTATSVPSESAFSQAAYLLRKQRSRLSPTNLSYSMFLKDKISKRPSV